MNIVAVDIGNTNVAIGLFLDGKEESVESLPGVGQAELRTSLLAAWEKIPVLSSSAEGKRDGVIVVSSVKPAWTELVGKMVAEDLDERIHVVGDDIPWPMSAWVDEPEKVGTDRIVSAAAAYAVVEDAVVVADFGTAVTIRALKDHTAQLPTVTVHRPETPYGKNTADAINCGLYYSVIGALEEIVRRYAEEIGHWPQTVITGAAAATIKDDCPFVDNYVPHLVVKGIVLAYQKYLETQSEMV